MILFFSLTPVMHIAYSLDRNPYPQLLDESKQVFYLTSHCTKKSHTSHIGAQAMCKRIGLHNQTICDQHVTSQGIIEEVPYQRIGRGQNQACFPRVGRNDILAPLQSSFYWLILAFSRMYCA